MYDSADLLSTLETVSKEVEAIAMNIRSGIVPPLPHATSAQVNLRLVMGRLREPRTPAEPANSGLKLAADSAETAGAASEAPTTSDAGGDSASSGESSETAADSPPPDTGKGSGTGGGKPAKPAAKPSKKK